MTRLGDLLDFGEHFKPLVTINLPKSSTFLGIFCKGVKIYHFSSEIIFGQLLQTFGNSLLVTLIRILSGFLERSLIQNIKHGRIQVKLVLTSE